MQLVVQIFESPNSDAANFAPPGFLKWLDSWPYRMGTLITRLLLVFRGNLLMYSAKQVIHDA
jgi:hypothetical protein